MIIDVKNKAVMSIFQPHCLFLGIRFAYYRRFPVKYLSCHHGILAQSRQIMADRGGEAIYSD